MREKGGKKLKRKEEKERGKGMGLGGKREGDGFRGVEERGY